MAIDFYDGATFDGLFNLQGKAFAAQEALNLSRGTTIPAAVLAVLNQFELLTNTDRLSRTITGLPSSVEGFQSGGASLASALQSYAGQLLIEMADADNPLSARTLNAALQELIRQMIANSQSVDASTVAVSVSVGGSNTGDGVLIVSKKRGDGLVQENALAENIIATVTSDGTPETATITLIGEDSEGNLLSEQWPRGSGCSKSISCVDAAASLIANGDMEDEDDRPNAPDDWIVSVGTIGTTLKMTDVEIQTVAMSGTPTAGTYTLSWANAAGKTQTTIPLAYNASSSDVQTALRQLKGLELVTVVESGSTPNLTHTITFTGRGGNVAQLTSTDRTTGGSHSIAHATTSAGTAQVYAGSKAVQFLSDGSELTTLNMPLTGLSPKTAYAFSMWAICDVIPAAGVVTIDLVDGIGGSVIQDAQASNNSFTFNASSLTTSWQHIRSLVSGETVFRTPAVVPPLVYLRIRISTAITNTRSMFVDHVALEEMEELYPGGPLIKAFSGATDLKVGDTWTLAVTNDRAGEIQEYYNRNFGMASLGLLLPSNASGSETIPDTVI